MKLAKPNPTPEERAELIIRRLEQIIHEEKAKRVSVIKSKQTGMSYRKWQDTARMEITAAIHNAERIATIDAWVINRLLMIGGSCLVSIGFLGAVFAMDRIDREIAAAVAAVFGVVFLSIGCEWPIRRAAKTYKAKKRAEAISRIINIDKQIKMMERHLQDKKDALKQEINYTNS